MPLVLAVLLACNDSTGSFVVDTSHTGTSQVSYPDMAIDSALADSADTGSLADTGTHSGGPTSDTAPPPDTASSDTAPPGISDECAGVGPATLAIGHGGLLGFLALTDGDDIELLTDSLGNYGFRLELSTAGLDTQESMSTVVELDLPTVPGSRSRRSVASKGGRRSPRSACWRRSRRRSGSRPHCS